MIEYIVRDDGDDPCSAEAGELPYPDAESEQGLPPDMMVGYKLRQTAYGLPLPGDYKATFEEGSELCAHKFDRF